MPLHVEARDWVRTVGPDTFVCSTNREYLQLDAINAAFASDMMWWAQKLPLPELEKIVGNSLCFALYLIRPGTAPDSTDELDTTTAQAGRGEDHEGGPQVMIGFARIITDHVTFGYLTDVYVLPEHQGKGLCKWMMQCLNEVLDSLPSLRRFLLLTQNPGAARIYENTLGARRGPSNGMVLFEKAGAGRKVPPSRS